MPVSLKDRSLVERFIRVPWYIHRLHYPNPHWVPPVLNERRRYLDIRRNPFFQHAEAAFWIAQQAGRDVGRIAAVRDVDWERSQAPKTGTFGLFESPANQDVANALIDAATGWLRDQALKRMVGPFDLSSNYTTGLLVDGFDSDPYIQMPYNPPYYNNLLTRYGFTKEKDLWQWGIDTTQPAPERISHLASRIRERHRISVRRMSLREWNNEIDKVQDLYNDIWADNWAFVPLRPTEMRHIANELRIVVRPELALMAEVGNRPVAMALTILNLNPILKRLDGRLVPFGAIRLLWDLRIRSKVTSGRLMLLGIRREYRGCGIDSLLFVETLKAASNLGWRYSEIGWTSEDNHAVNRAIKAMNGWRVKTYRVYTTNL